MMTDLNLAKEQLMNGAYTCVLRKNDMVYCSQERGVKPLLIWLDSDIDFNGYSAADKVVGKAAAMLYVLLGVSNVHAIVISVKAKEVLEKNGIEVTYDSLVERIHNRTNTGFCPMEEAVWEMEDLQEALQAVRDKVAALAVNKPDNKKE